MSDYALRDEAVLNEPAVEGVHHQRCWRQKLARYWIASSLHVFDSAPRRT